MVSHSPTRVVRPNSALPPIWMTPIIQVKTRSSRTFLFWCTVWDVEPFLSDTDVER
jgi:hypothetical protein